MIGDTCYDVNGARANGIDVMAVTYGFEKADKLEEAKPDYIAHSTKDIVTILVEEEDEKK